MAHGVLSLLNVICTVMCYGYIWLLVDYIMPSTSAKATDLFLENHTQRALAREGVRTVLGFAGATSEYEVVEPKVACPPPYPPTPFHKGSTILCMSIFIHIVTASAF